MAIDKAVYGAPRGVEILEAQPVGEIVVEVVDDDDEALDGADAVEEVVDEEGFSDNLAEYVEEGVMSDMVSTLLTDVKEDLASRTDWEKMYTEGLKLMGLQYEERTEPWSGACGVFHPMITEACVRFQAETIMETFPAAGPVKTKIIGKQTLEKDAAGLRVAEDLNWQLTENMVEFRPEHERMLWSLPGTGSAFKKVYRDAMLNRQTSVFVPADDMILPYGMTDLITCHRVTHRMRKTKEDLQRMQHSGFYLDIDLGTPPTATVENIQKKKDKESGVTAINDKRFVVYEICVDWDLKGYEDKDENGEPTGLPLPYIVTVLTGVDKILSIRRNWMEDDPDKIKRVHYVHYQYIPGFGPYGLGLFHLIGGFAKSATSILRQLVDAGTLSNLPGGMKTRALRIKGDDTPIAPGEFRDVDVGSGVLRDNIMPLPYKEPSMVLAGLLEKIIEEGKRFASTADMKISDMSNQAPVGSTLAILERTLKVMTAVQARVHFAFKQEIKLIAEIVRDDSPKNEEYSYDVDGPQGRRAKYDDYRYVEIIPVSDPNAATMSQRVVQYQAVIQLSQTAPQIYDLPHLHRQMLNVLGIKNAEKLIPIRDDMKPQDPVQENQNMLTGKPVRAFAYQDHEAHIAVHMMAMQDPLVQQLIGQNPQAQAIMAAGQAHVAEHVGYAYRNKMSVALGAPLPQVDEGEGLPEDVELQLSKLLAQAAPQVLAQSKVLVAQQQAQQNAQDPLLKIQEQELAIKQKDVDVKEKKVALDAAAKADELALKREALEMKGQTDGARIGATAAQAKDAADRNDQREGARMGIDVAKHKEQLATQERIARQSRGAKG